jgi:hypothetical protein
VRPYRDGYFWGWPSTVTVQGSALHLALASWRMPVLVHVGDVRALDVGDFVGEGLGGVGVVEGVADSYRAGVGVGPSVGGGGVAALEGVAE